jgi:hypothetical protein
VQEERGGQGKMGLGRANGEGQACSAVQRKGEGEESVQRET